MNSRTYYDPLHQSINLDLSDPAEAMVVNLIDSIPFQRLRRIKQLGPASLTFHGAESSRFTHSLGVFHIARRSLNQLIKTNPQLDNFRGLLYGAALLHDLGHGPLSHSSEEMFGINHEYWSSKLIKEHLEIRIALENFSKGTAEKVSNLIGKAKCPNKAILALISSQLDCDRLDYLLRDSYATGTRYGQIDLERILSGMTIAPDGDLAIHPKALMAVEHYLVIRDLMYRSVYNHRLNEVCNWLLEQIIKIARELGESQIWADKYMSKWLWEKEKIDIETFLANDDILTGYHIFRWKEDAPDPLSELCKRFLNRNLLKAFDIGYLTNESQLKVLAIARKLAQREGENPDLSCALRKQKLHGYHPYKSGLRIWDGQNLSSLENASPLVERLKIPKETSWLIYPRDIHEGLKEEINLLPSTRPNKI